MTPLVLTLGVLFFLYAIHWIGWNYAQVDAFKRLEWMTFDWRTRVVQSLQMDETNRFTGVFIDDNSIRALNQGHYLGMRMRPPWPRRVYGDLVKNLDQLGARLVVFDILFPEKEPAWEAMYMDSGGGIRLSSDEYFGLTMKEAGNVVIAAEERLLPDSLFFRSAASVGHIQSAFDHGVRRRFKPFITSEQFLWHPSVEHMSRALGFDLDLKERPKPGETNLVFDLPGGGLYRVPLLPDGSLDPEELGLEKEDGPHWPYEWITRRIWHLGLVMGAHYNDINLEQAQVTDAAVYLTSPKLGIISIPLDEEGFAYCSWNQTWESFKEHSVNILSVLLQPESFLNNPDRPNPFEDKFVIIGSAATGSNMSDIGTTPLENNAVLTIQLVNVARSLIGDRFILPFSYYVELLLITFLGSLSSILTWRLRALKATFCILMAMLVYVIICIIALGVYQVWIPLFFPLFGALLMMHAVLVTYRVVFEQKEQRRVKAIFSKVVSPNVVSELLDAEKLNLGGRSEEVTVLFTDVRGFTRMTDRLMQEVTDRAPEELEKLAQETLETVNIYLTSVANRVKEHHGTLDKYMGDCVMAFWGAPSANPDHAIDAVRSAIDAQKALKRLNEARMLENEKRQFAFEQAGKGQATLNLLPILSMGTGINTGRVTVGLMGSEEHILNYTVFGREVNLASRLEGAAGAGKILITESTHAMLKSRLPELAEACVRLEPLNLKGITHPVNVLEVPWDGAVGAPQLI